MLSTEFCYAQSWKDLFNKENIGKVVNKENIEKVVSDISGKNTAGMTGTWRFTGSAIELKADNILNQAGGDVAATLAEKKLNEQLAKHGITEGKLSFTFQADSTFQAKLNNRNMDGTYSYDETSRLINLKFNKLLNLQTKITCTSTHMDMLFNSDKLLKLITFLSSKSKSTTLKSISSLTENYNGMMLGFSLKKE
ncbi:hypothetical protein EVA_10007 [gut metagenome]|uniref:DUF4923 domain-containing protein n=1 Tax=gut metagenome TaxID=749906 RepID=J9G3T7_9ZZZZ